MVEIFKTHIHQKVAADELIQQIQKCCPAAKINVDLDDCDRVLRIEDDRISVSEIIKLTADLGHYCEVIL